MESTRASYATLSCGRVAWNFRGVKNKAAGQIEWAKLGPAEVASGDGGVRVGEGTGEEKP